MDRFPRMIGNFSWFWLSCLGPLVLLLQKHIYIILLSSLLILSVPDEGYSGNMSCTLNLMSILLFLKWRFLCNYVSPSNEGRRIVLVWFFLPLPLLLSEACPDHNFFVFPDRSIIFGMWVHDHKAVCRIP